MVKKKKEPTTSQKKSSPKLSLHSKIDEIYKDVLRLAHKFQDIFGADKIRDDISEKDEEGFFVIFMRRDDKNKLTPVVAPLSFGWQMSEEDIIQGIKDAFINILMPPRPKGEA
jgi:hypothetical protein